MPYNYFKGVSDYSDFSIDETLIKSTIMWADWCFLNIGAYLNINIPTSGNLGGDFSRLRPVTDPRYTDGKIWETARSNLVWESGLSQINISGVYVNGTIRQSGYTVNYPLGRVIFDTPVAQSSVVRMEYSAKHIKILDGNELPFFRQSQQNSYKIENGTFLQTKSGEWTQFPESRLQYPLVAVQRGPTQFRGFELGNDNLNAFPTIYMHVVGETKSDVDRISEILARQKDSKFYLVNEDMMAQSGIKILDFNGNKTNTTMTYPEIVNEGYRGRECYITEASLENFEVLAPNLYKRTVKLKTDMIF
jgi:hypothetical protein